MWRLLTSKIHPAQVSNPPRLNVAFQPSFDHGADRPAGVPPRQRGTPLQHRVHSRAYSKPPDRSLHPSSGLSHKGCSGQPCGNSYFIHIGPTRSHCQAQKHLLFVRRRWMAEPPRILDLGLSKPLSIRDRLARRSACLQRCRKVPSPHARRRVFSGRGGDVRNKRSEPLSLAAKPKAPLCGDKLRRRPQSPPENSLTAKAGSEMMLPTLT